MHLKARIKIYACAVALIMNAVLISTKTQAQGCSDAGACTIPGFLPDFESKSPFQLDFRTSLEGSEPGALIISPQLWLHVQRSKKFRADLKLPFWLVNDPDFGNVASFSDPVVSFSWLVFSQDAHNIDVIAGMRIGMNNANLKGKTGDLPMDYQSSLGTTDIIFGGKYGFNGLSASLALQFPVWQYNTNQNVVRKYVEYYDDFDFVLEYERMADLVIRVDRRWEVNNWFFQVGLLPIFHLANDKIRSRENLGEVLIEGSKGLTINVPFSAFYQLQNWSFGIQGGFPVVVRNERPDGLTRKYVVQPTITLNL